MHGLKWKTILTFTTVWNCFIKLSSLLKLFLVTWEHNGSKKTSENNITNTMTTVRSQLTSNPDISIMNTSRCHPQARLSSRMGIVYYWLCIVRNDERYSSPAWKVPWGNRHHRDFDPLGDSHWRFWPELASTLIPIISCVPTG